MRHKIRLAPRIQPESGSPWQVQCSVLLSPQQYKHYITWQHHETFIFFPAFLLIHFTEVYIYHRQYFLAQHLYISLFRSCLAEKNTVSCSGGHLGCSPPTGGHCLLEVSDRAILQMIISEHHQITVNHHIYLCISIYPLSVHT